MGSSNHDNCLSNNNIMGRALFGSCSQACMTGGGHEATLTCMAGGGHEATLTCSTIFLAGCVLRGSDCGVSCLLQLGLKDGAPREGRGVSVWF